MTFVYIFYLFHVLVNYFVSSSLSRTIGLIVDLISRQDRNDFKLIIILIIEFTIKQSK